MFAVQASGDIAQNVFRQNGLEFVQIGQDPAGSQVNLLGHLVHTIVKTGCIKDLGGHGNSRRRNASIGLRVDREHASDPSRAP